MFKRYKVLRHEFGLKYVEDEFVGVLMPGVHWFVDLLGRIRVDVVSAREPFLVREDNDVLVKSGALEGVAQVIELTDRQRALVWIDGRFDRLLVPGLHVILDGFHRIEVERVELDGEIFAHAEIEPILARLVHNPHGLDVFAVQDGIVGLVYLDGVLKHELEPGRYAFWRGVGMQSRHLVDLRETSVDVGGQELMTADKVSLRINAVATYRVVDARRSVSAVSDLRGALYREAQLALRAVVGTRELDVILSDKDAVASELEAVLKQRAADYGVALVSFGIKDVILPGEMKDLLNQVTEARKAAEAAVITRREEVAAMRSQANSARLLRDNPTLMRLREIEALERVSTHAKLTVVLGEQGLADRVINLV